MSNMLNMALAAGLPLIALAIFMAFVRLIRGPSFPDRVVALDIMATMAIGLIALYAMESGEVIFLDVALILALVTFLGTVAFAYYVERRQVEMGNSE
jgi:multicomponent Na+:H+ antiporter subunit F